MGGTFTFLSLLIADRKLNPRLSRTLTVSSLNKKTSNLQNYFYFAAALRLYLLANLLNKALLPVIYKISVYIHLSVRVYQAFDFQRFQDFFFLEITQIGNPNFLEITQKLP